MKLLKNTRKKVVTLAVASALGGVAMMSAPAHAMNVAQDGKGEVLLFPYYSVLNGFDTIFSVTNTSDRTVLFKVRWREAKNSREVRDFNVALSPHDVWTAGVTINGSGALVRTFDKSCTSPILPAGPNGSTQVDFTSVGYDGSDPAFPYDNGGRALSRVQEGYFEVIEMAISTIPESSITSAATIEYNTQHVTGVPRNCAVFDNAFLDAANLVNAANGSGAFSTFTAPANVLVGNSTLINVASGKAIDATPTAIQNFQDTQTIIFTPGDLSPSLGDGEIAPSAFFLLDGVPTTVPVAAAVVPPSVDAVSVLLMANRVINEYATGGSDTSSAKTDWVVTFPTKHHYTDDGLTAVQPPFAQLFSPTGASCDPISLSIYDREEKTQVNVGQTQFSPRPTGPSGASLCNEVNVLTFNNSAVLGSGVQLSVDTSTVGTAGWAALTLTANVPLLGYTRLPTIGFSAITRDNTADAGNNRNYGSGSDHARVIVAPAP
ncbi:MAG: hypothetical protein E6R14_10245 [Thermomicrobiales bacterium]|nr:MAG: hypothetical protein E6R14_10245 [Thermomicrobiales bacterium]